MKTIHYLMATAIVLASMASVTAQAQVRRPTLTPTMAAMPEPAQAERTIEVTAQTKQVNVKRLEVVQFVSHTNGSTKTFAWQAPGHTTKPFKLGEIAPAGFVDHSVMVYVTPSRLSR
ncbi:CzcE family metal-binding protein [Aquabacterium sp.]|uniref:CzcE family metal-binding protein n=1 Tax=Aquabacterium sp. TaxID=1872578 RepID=UPI0035AE3744